MDRYRAEKKATHGGTIGMIRHRIPQSPKFPCIRPGTRSMLPDGADGAVGNGNLATATRVRWRAVCAERGGGVGGGPLALHGSRRNTGFRQKRKGEPSPVPLFLRGVSAFPLREARP